MIVGILAFVGFSTLWIFCWLGTVSLVQKITDDFTDGEAEASLFAFGFPFWSVIFICAVIYLIGLLIYILVTHKEFTTNIKSMKSRIRSLEKKRKRK